MIFKHARITITHVCFIPLTLAGSLGRCLKTRPNGLTFKQLPRDAAVLMHEKTCLIPIILRMHIFDAQLTNVPLYQFVQSNNHETHFLNQR